MYVCCVMGPIFSEPNSINCNVRLCTSSRTKKTDVAIRFVRSDYVEMGALKRLRRRPFVLAALNLFFCKEYNLWQIAGRLSGQDCRDLVLS